MTVNQLAPRGSNSSVPEPLSPTSSSSGTAVASAPSTPSQPHYTRTEYDEIPNVEDDPTVLLGGYPKLANLIAEYPDFEAFQSFKDLNIKSLLYYQAELAELREDLHRLEWRDFRTKRCDPRSKYCIRADKLLIGGDPETLGKQKELLKKIRKVLKKYNAALLQYSQISALPEADSFNVNSLYRWLSMCPRAHKIQGPGADTWGDLTKNPPKSKSFKQSFWRLLCSPFWTSKEEKREFDLIVPRAEKKVDGLARWVANEFVPFWQCLEDCIRKIKQSSGDEEKHQEQEEAPEETSEGSGETTLNTFKEGPMLRFTSFVATIIACLLPTVAIAVLAQLHTTAELLGIIALFTAIFAAGLMLLVDSGTSRVEIFTATAAFSAVMVVFVQNQTGGTYSKGGTSLALNGTKI